MKVRRLAAVLAMAAGSVLPMTANAQVLDSEFTYQGLLTQGGARVDGTADFHFYLYDAAVGGAPLAGPVAVNNVDVENGVFTVTLEFNPELFDGRERWLRTDVRSPAGGGAFTTLAPRQNVTSAPYALQMRGIFVDDNRLVGINETNPTNRLHVGGSIFADGPTYDILLNANSSSSFVTYDADGDRSAYVFHSLLSDGGQFVFEDEFGLIGGFGASNTSGSGVGILLDSEFRSTNVEFQADDDGDDDNGGSAGSLTLRSAGSASGGVFRAENSSGRTTVLLDAGPTGGGGLLQLYNDSGIDILNAYNGSFGGEVFFDSDTGGRCVIVQPDFDGTGGFFAVAKSDSSYGFLVNGNQFGTQQPYVSIDGTSDVIFNSTATGDSSVLLPSASVNSSELSNEPGVATATEGFSSTVLTGTSNTNIQSRTISCPSAGYVLALGTVQFTVQHTDGTADAAWLGVSDTSASFPSNQDVSFGIGASTDSGEFAIPVTVQAVFDVSAGNNTFYLVGRRTSGDPTIEVWDQQLSLVFIPSAYGTIEAPLQGPGRVIEDASMGRAGLTHAEIEAEQIQAMLLAEVRREAEMQAMREEVEALRRLVEADMARSGQGRPIEQELQTSSNSAGGALGENR